MTFLELNKNIKEKYSNKVVNSAIIFYLSSKVKNGKDMLIHLKEEIDFNFSDFNKLLDEYYLDHKPLGQIIHQANFLGNEFIVDPMVHVPRNDTEYWVENLHAFLLLEFNYHELLDLCAGSGNIGISIKKNFPYLNLTSLDIDISAVNNIKKNLKKFHLDANVIHDDLFNWIKTNQKKFDVIVMNPPYVPINELDEELIKYENKISFNNSNDPLAFYKLVVENLKKITNEHFVFACEFGYNQKNELKKIIDHYGYGDYTKFFKDLSNQDRYFIIKK